MDLAWFQGVGRVFIPDVKFQELPEGCYPRMIHGSKYTLAVFDSQDKCVGWMVAKAPNQGGQTPIG